ncbi:MAG: hypothetical protein NUV55_00980 [Sulfuricaulis sp.]|uniref:hypothetical protein n=1 Tax=Sulfuricaulis sp. TaxID=2003553 RepID=UPI0025F214ED|nr:hypothetical protein [Sulfuricaulis sp.]MCR4345770.1 hypothetical protein [Sulfuricaulis sp.]
MPLKILIGICLLRASPQDLTASRAGMLGALVAYAAAGMLGVLDVLTFENAILAAAVDTLLLTAVTHLVLQWRQLENRLTQTLTALAGCGALLSLLAWGAAGLVREVFQPEWVWAAFLVWYTLVFGHILRHALSISLAAALAASLFYLIFSIGVTGLFMNPIPATN